jgi:hypothetical protein
VYEQNALEKCDGVQTSDWAFQSHNALALEGNGIVSNAKP